MYYHYLHKGLMSLMVIDIYSTMGSVGHGRGSDNLLFENIF